MLGLAEDVQDQAVELVDTLSKAKGQAMVQALKELHQLVTARPSTRKTVVEFSGIGLLAKVSLSVAMLNEGTVGTRINCTKFIEMLMEEKDFRLENVSSFSLYLTNVYFTGGQQPCT
ncbi:putative U-box domain-containing protein 30 [Cocos nucifera]|nr:putative U-box domain-containing protein 30 [Cocos nucifera]